MRTLITTILTLAVGVFAASAIAWLIGRLWPAAQTPVFWVLAISWLWLGWRYASARDRRQL